MSFDDQKRPHATRDGVDADQQIIDWIGNNVAVECVDLRPALSIA